jgi:hypothetical protein
MSSIATNKPARTLEQKIASALTADVKSADIAALVAETEVAITQAAEAERAKVLDPIVSPDAAMAHGAMTEAAFMRERLRTVLPRLQQRYQEVMAHEYHAQWEKDFETVKVKHDALAAEFREVYRQAMAKLVDLLTRMTACDRACYRVNASAPAGEPRRLAGAELAARGLERFTVADPSIVRELKLPDFERSDRMAWPPPQTFDSALISPLSASRRYSADWGLAAEEEARASQERQERAEQEAEARTVWRGPKWWMGERV